jgi:hypothetical protein
MGVIAAATQEKTDLLRRLSAMPSDSRAGADVRTEQLAYPIVAEPGPTADGLRTRFVADEAQGGLETQPLAVVAIVGDAHEYLLECPVGWGSVDPLMKGLSTHFFDDKPDIRRGA